ncbi:unnamed protein product [Allacma fusca]|uniref:Uncharacterized protein n=1 Tax=Allacma fusca TaxID=39272 RepID=A0A8J2K3X6_9HEXA|nr:unnamed protein product [Allacma fusca]
MTASGSSPSELQLPKVHYCRIHSEKLDARYPFTPADAFLGCSSSKLEFENFVWMMSMNRSKTSGTVSSFLVSNKTLRLISRVLLPGLFDHKESGFRTIQTTLVYSARSYTCVLSFESRLISLRWSKLRVTK